MITKYSAPHSAFGPQAEFSILQGDPFLLVSLAGQFPGWVVANGGEDELRALADLMKQAKPEDWESLKI